MKTKFLLIAISCITLLSFSSCEDEMDKTGNGGGGKESANEYSTFMKRDAEINYPDSLLYNPNTESGLGFK